MKNKLETITNVTIIIVSIIFVTTLIYHSYFRGGETESSLNLKVGTRINLTNVKWNVSNKTFVLVLKKGCVYCAESADFYKKLIPNLKSKKIQVVAVLPSDIAESEDYLSGLGLPPVEVRKATLESISVKATPTILLLDSDGKVTGSWVGQLKPNVEKEILNKL